MECRICHQSIGFLRGRFPERKKTTTLAVHEAEMPMLLQQVSCVVVNPHPGAQRKLRQELEAHHSGHVTQSAANTTAHAPAGNAAGVASSAAATNGDHGQAAAPPMTTDTTTPQEAAGAAAEAEPAQEMIPQQEPERAEARAHATR